MNRQTELGVIWGGKGSEKLQMIQALQGEVEGIKREMAGLQASMQAVNQWEAKMPEMEAQMENGLKEMQRLEKIFNVPFIQNMEDSMEDSRAAVTRMEANMRGKCDRAYVSSEIEFVTRILRREIFEFYEERPSVFVEKTKATSGNAPKHRLPSLEAGLKMLIRRSCEDTERKLERSNAFTEHRLDDKIDENNEKVAFAALKLANGYEYLQNRVTEIEKVMGMKAPSRRMLPAPPAGQELHDAIEKLQARPPEELGAWTKPSTTLSEFSTLMGMINDTNLLVQKIYYDLDLVKTAMTDMDDRLHSVETALQPKT
jgi:hypothetical protein